jgi:hypothetical protein
MRRSWAAGVVVALIACGRVVADDALTDASPTDAAAADASSSIDASATDSAPADATAFTTYLPCTSCDASVVLAEAGARYLAADETNVYWSANGQQNFSAVISKCPIGACVPDVLFTGYAARIALNGTSLYAWTQSIAYACTTDGCDGGTILSAMLNDGVFGFAAAGASVFWSEQLSFDWDHAKLRTCAPSSCDAGATFAANQPAPRDVVADDASVFWINLGEPVDGGIDWIDYGDGGIFSCAMGACDGGVELAAHQTNAHSLVANSSSVLWISNGSIFRCKKTGCGGKPEVLATFAGTVASLAVDDVAAYFVIADPPNAGPWRVIEMLLDGSAPPSAITSDEEYYYFSNIALNSTNVFWIAMSGDILRTSK